MKRSLTAFAGGALAVCAFAWPASSASPGLTAPETTGLTSTSPWVTTPGEIKRGEFKPIALIDAAGLARTPRSAGRSPHHRAPIARL